MNPGFAPGFTGLLYIVMGNDEMKKIIAVCLSLVLVFLFASCKSKDQQEEIEDEVSLESVLPENEDETIETAPTLELADNQKPFVPDNATVVGVSDGTVSYITQDSYEDTKNFYQALLVDLGAEGEESEPVVNKEGLQTWFYTGTYNNGENIEIQVTTNGEQVSAVVNY